MFEILMYVIIGAGAGVLSGLFGIGGGIVIVPALMFSLGFTQLKAQGTSLAILLPPVGILGFLEYYKKGNVDIKAAIIICITVIIGVKFGAKLANYVPLSIVRKSFAVFLVFVAVKIFFEK